MTLLWHVLATGLVASVAAQQPTQQGAIVYLRDARAAVVRESLYLEGGIYGSLIDASIGAISPSKGGLSIFNFSTPFNSSSNWTSLFTDTQIITNPSQMVHVGGGMVADDYEWYSFGGRSYIFADNHTGSTGIIRDAVYGANDAKTPALGIDPSYVIQSGNSTNRFITNGAAVSAPSEELGFYFGGIRSANGTDMTTSAQGSSNSSAAPTTPVNSMLRIDMSDFGSSVWNEYDLPSFVPTRADAVMAWLPVGQRGVLVVIGGVSYPASLYNSLCTLNSSLAQENNQTGPSFMNTVSVYDIASDTWFSQQTYGTAPPQLAQACAGVASTSDLSIHNVHVYGGYDGNTRNLASDDVWILSIPSFTWVKAYTGNTNHGRYAHVCATPYPDQLMVVGGTTKCGGSLNTTSLADIFNMTTLEFTGSYDPSVWSNYSVPSVVSSAIKSQPTASMQQALTAIMAQSYAGKLTTYYPYPYNKTVPVAPPVITPTPTPPPKSRPSWLIPVAVVVPIVGVLIIAGLLLFCLRRSRKSDSHRSVSQWLRGQSAPEKSLRSDDETTQVDTIHEVGGEGYFKNANQTAVAELNSGSHMHNATSLGSPYGSPRGPLSPQDPEGAELHSNSVPQELPAEVHTMTQSPNFRNHPLYPPSVSGHAPSTTNTAQPVSSPTNGPVTPYELPQKRSKEGMLPSPPEDMVLGQTEARSPRIVQAGVRSPHIKTTPMAGDISPNISAADVSPDQKPADIPVTPPSKPINVNRPGHNRNVSSISSGLPDLSSPSPREDQRQSVAISALPDSPSSHVRHSAVHTDVSPSSPVPARPGLGIDMDQRTENEMPRTQIKRKMVQNYSRNGAQSPDGQNNQSTSGTG